MTITTPEGNKFILYENDVVTIDLFSSLFTDNGELKGSYSYSGKAPLIPNKRIIHYGDMLEKNTDGMLTNLQVQLGNIYWTNVNMLYEVNDQTEIEFSLTLNLSLINDKLKNTSLTEITFPIHSLGVTELEIQNSMTASSLNTDWKNIPYVFAPVMAPEFTGDVKNTDVTDGVIETDGYVNSMRIENGEFVFNAPNRRKDTRLKYISIPFFYLNFILKELANYLGLSAGGEVMDDPETSKFVIFNINQAYLPLGSLGMYITASDHLPAITASEFIKNIALWGIYPMIRANTNELLFKFKRDYNKNKTRDWSYKVRNYEEVSSRPYGGYRIELENPVIQHDFLERLGDHVIEGNGEKKIELKVSTLASGFDSDETLKWNVPFFNSEGNVLDSKYDNLSNFVSIEDKRDFPITFLYYNGLRANGDAIDYPKLSAVNEDNAKELFLTGAYNQYMRNFLLATEGAKEIKVDLMLDSTDVANWQDDDIIILKSRSMVNVSVLLKKLSIDVKSNSYFHHAQAEGIVLNSAVYKEPPSSRLYLKQGIKNIHRETDGTYRSDICDVSIELFTDKDCEIPYAGTEVIPVDLLINSMVRPDGGNQFFEESNTSVRIMMATPTVLYRTFLNRTFAGTVGNSYEINFFTIRESPRFHIV